MPMEWWALTKTATPASWPPMISMIFVLANCENPLAAERFRRRRAEHAELPQAVDDGRRDVGVAVDGRGVDVRFRELAQGGRGLLQTGGLGGCQFGIGKQQRRAELAEIETLGKAERLRAGEQHFFDLAALLLDLRRGQGHALFLGTWPHAAPQERRAR